MVAEALAPSLILECLHRDSSLCSFLFYGIDQIPGSELDLFNRWSHGGTYGNFSNQLVTYRQCNMVMDSVSSGGVETASFSEWFVSALQWLEHLRTLEASLSLALLNARRCVNCISAHREVTKPF